MILFLILNVIFYKNDYLFKSKLVWNITNFFMEERGDLNNCNYIHKMYERFKGPNKTTC